MPRGHDSAKLVGTGGWAWGGATGITQARFCVSSPGRYTWQVYLAGTQKPVFNSIHLKNGPPKSDAAFTRQADFRSQKSGRQRGMSLPQRAKARAIVTALRPTPEFINQILEMINHRVDQL